MKGVRDYSCGLEATLLEDDSVGHTGRATRSSIAHAGYDDIRPAYNPVDNVSGSWQGEVCFALMHDGLYLVKFLQQVGNGK
ncbi:MAG TPA: hypothetical protein VNL15_03265 [Dehalococcoidia bacterium]|nr:hypothetical protein [Dehalococcoidia bacterium]